MFIIIIIFRVRFIDVREKNRTKVFPPWTYSYLRSGARSSTSTFRKHSTSAERQAALAIIGVMFGLHISARAHSIVESSIRQLIVSLSAAVVQHCCCTRGLFFSQAVSAAPNIWYAVILCFARIKKYIYEKVITQTYAHGHYWFTTVSSQRWTLRTNGISHAHTYCK